MQENPTSIDESLMQWIPTVIVDEQRMMAKISNSRLSVEFLDNQDQL